MDKFIIGLYPFRSWKVIDPNRRANAFAIVVIDVYGQLIRLIQPEAFLTAQVIQFVEKGNIARGIVSSAVTMI